MLTPVHLETVPVNAVFCGAGACGFFCTHFAVGACFTVQNGVNSKKNPSFEPRLIRALHSVARSVGCPEKSRLVDCLHCTFVDFL